MPLVIPPRGDSPSRATFDELLAFVIAYSNLLVAAWEAGDRRLRPRDDPVPITRLREHCVPDYLLVWMLYQGHVEHVRPAANGRHGGPAAARDALLPSPSSSFALTESGEAFADQFLAAILVPRDEKAFAAAWDLLILGRLAPHYDKDERLFGWGRHVLKSFRQPSVNQELVLGAAEEMGWVSWFDDPLPRRAGGNPKVRLHDTIKDLNRRQRPHFVHFKGDGTGRRVGWEYL